MTLPDLHLSEDALAAYVDGILSPAADERAAKHLRSCAECRAAVDVEREAKALLGAAPDPSLPAGLMARLLDVPMTADLGGDRPGAGDRRRPAGLVDRIHELPIRGWSSAGRQPRRGPDPRSGRSAHRGRPGAARGPGGPGGDWRSRWPGWRSG